MPPVRADSTPRDTVKSPLAVSPRPARPELAGRRTHWDRDAIFESGALTLAELVAQVPGATAYHAGFFAAPTASAWYGEPGRVRVFLDGVELDALDPREGGVRDLAVIPLWPLEEVAIERAAGELRVHLRSWRVRLTTAQTRTDILTGSEDANLYRGFFGKRMQSGGVLQLAAQQYSTTSVRTAGDGDGLSAFVRVGFARGRLSVDAVTSRFGRTRSPTRRNFLGGTLDQSGIAAFEGKDAVSYVRAAWGNPDTTGFWIQAIAAALRHAETGDTTVDADTAVAQSQYSLSTGVSRGSAHLSATARIRVQGNTTRISPALRASWERDWLALSATYEAEGGDSTGRTDAIVLLAPRPWLHLLAAHSIQTPRAATGQGPSRTASRAEIGARILNRWITAGIVERSAAQVLGMPVFDTAFAPVLRGDSRGIEAGLAGPIRGPFSFSWRAVRWSEEVLYRPLVESYADVRISSGFERQIVRKTFHLTAALTHEYRGSLVTPVAGGGTRRTEGRGVFGSLVEIRIGTAHIFWYNRNSVGTVYETVPGYLMPRLVQMYGVRWEFWN